MNANVCGPQEHTPRVDANNRILEERLHYRCHLLLRNQLPKTFIECLSFLQGIACLNNLVVE